MKKNTLFLLIFVIVSLNFMCKKMDNNLTNDETLIKLPNHLITQPLGHSQEDVDNYNMLVNSMNVNFEKIKAIHNNAINLSQLNLQMAFYAKIDSSSGIGLGIVIASNTDSSLVYCLLSKDKNFSINKPVVIKIKGREEVAFYDLDLNLYKNVFISSTGKISSTLTTPIFSNNYSNRVSLMNTNRTFSSCGQATMNCITDAYSNHGWLSVWTTVQSLYMPATGVAIAAACAAKNCL